MTYPSCRQVHQSLVRMAESLYQSYVHLCGIITSSARRHDEDSHPHHTVIGDIVTITDNCPARRLAVQMTANMLVTFIVYWGYVFTVTSAETGILGAVLYQALMMNFLAANLCCLCYNHRVIQRIVDRLWATIGTRTSPLCLITTTTISIVLRSSCCLLPPMSCQGVAPAPPAARRTLPPLSLLSANRPPFETGLWVPQRSPRVQSRHLRRHECRGRGGRKGGNLGEFGGEKIRNDFESL
jgi:hypothetical protein